MEQNTDGASRTNIEVPSHRKALAGALMKAHREIAVDGARPRRSLRERITLKRIGIALTPAIALGVAVLLTITLLGSPLSVEKVMAGTEEWYSTQRTKGRWEHTVASIELTPEDPLEPSDNPPETEPLIFDYETWRDTETGNTKALVKDPETGEVLETLIGLRERNEGVEVWVPPETTSDESDEIVTGYQEPLYTHRVYTDKPDGESMIFDISTHSGHLMTVPGPLEGDENWSVEDDKIYIEFVNGISPVEIDPARLSFLEGWIKENMEVGDFEMEERFIPELNKKGLVVSTIAAIAVTEPSMVDGKEMCLCRDYEFRYYLEPKTFEYLGAAEIVTTYESEGTTENGQTMEFGRDYTDPSGSKCEETLIGQILYKEFEFTDEPVDMDTAGMRELQGWWQEL